MRDLLWMRSEVRGTKISVLKGVKYCYKRIRQRKELTEDTGGLTG